MAVTVGVGLFVVLTFVGFALFELLRKLPIHPLQYLLVGLATLARNDGTRTTPRFTAGSAARCPRAAAS